MKKQHNIIDRKRKVENIEEDSSTHKISDGCFKKLQIYLLKDALVNIECHRIEKIECYDYLLEDIIKYIITPMYRSEYSDIMIEYDIPNFIKYHAQMNTFNYLQHNLKDISLPLKPNPIFNGKLYTKEEFPLLQELISLPKNVHSFCRIIIKQIEKGINDQRCNSIYLLLLEYIHDGTTHILSPTVKVNFDV
jgi:hypothetical protein